MASRNQNRPTRSPSSVLNKKDGIDQVPLDKRRKVGLGILTGSPAIGRTRQAFSVVSNRKEPAVGSDAGTKEGSECGNVEFTNEEVDALLNEKYTAKMFDFMGKLEHFTEHTKRLKLCIKWFQQAKETQQLEEEKLRNALESAEKKCTETGVEMRNRTQEFTSSILELQKFIGSLEEKLAKEESDKLSALECHRREEEAAKKLQDALSEELEKIQQEKCAVEKRVASFEDLYKHFQEYNISLQLYSLKLQADLGTTNESLKMVNMEKSAIVNHLQDLRRHNTILQEQLSSFKALQEETAKEKEASIKELQRVQGEVQHLRNDRDYQVAQVHFQNWKAG